MTNNVSNSPAQLNWKTNDKAVRYLTTFTHFIRHERSWTGIYSDGFHFSFSLVLPRDNVISFFALSLSLSLWFFRVISPFFVIFVFAFSSPFPFVYTLYCPPPTIPLRFWLSPLSFWNSFLTVCRYIHEIAPGTWAEGHRNWQQIADARLGDYKINFPLRRRGEEKGKGGEGERRKRKGKKDEKRTTEGKERKNPQFPRCRSNHDQLIRSVISANCFH